MVEPTSVSNRNAILIIGYQSTNRRETTCFQVFIVEWLRSGSCLFALMIDRRKPQNIRRHQRYPYFLTKFSQLSDLLDYFVGLVLNLNDIVDIIAKSCLLWSKFYNYLFLKNVGFCCLIASPVLNNNSNCNYATNDAGTKRVKIYSMPENIYAKYASCKLFPWLQCFESHVGKPYLRLIVETVRIIIRPHDSSR